MLDTCGVPLSTYRVPPAGLIAMARPFSPTRNRDVGLPLVIAIWSTRPVFSSAYTLPWAGSGATDTVSEGIGTVPRMTPVAPTMVTLADDDQAVSTKNAGLPGPVATCRAGAGRATVCSRFWVLPLSSSSAPECRVAMARASTPAGDTATDRAVLLTGRPGASLPDEPNRNSPVSSRPASAHMVPSGCGPARPSRLRGARNMRWGTTLVGPVRWGRAAGWLAVPQPATSRPAAARPTSPARRGRAALAAVLPGGAVSPARRGRAGLAAVLPGGAVSPARRGRAGLPVTDM